MAFDLNDLGIDDSEPEPESTGSESNEDILQDIVNEVETTEEETELDNYMAEVDQRLEVASFYRALLKNPLFGNNIGPAANTVQKEVRGFCRSRLAVLMGIKPEASSVPVSVASQFSNEQAAVLGQVADQLIQKARNGNPTVSPARIETPVVVQVTPAPAPRPTIQAKPKLAAKPAPKPQIKASPLAKKGPPKPLFEEKVVGTDENGKDIKIKNQRIQRPAGMVPFPSNPEAVIAAQAANSPQLTGKGAGQGVFDRLVKHHSNSND